MTRTLIRYLLAIVIVCSSLRAQEACAPPATYAPPQGQLQANMFSPQQEIEFGEIVAEQVERQFRIVEDEKLNAYLQGIGDRLLRNAAAPMQIRFQLIDVGMINAFTMPGGRIYVTRKLVAFAHSEDELAGILGHEIGHVMWRHAAIDMSQAFRKVLKVESVGDRRDIYEKYNRLLDTWARKADVSLGKEDREQLAADQMAVYLIARAGYEPSAFSAIWDRLADTKGKTGNWLGDLFGTTPPSFKRLREAINTVGRIAPECRAPRAAGAAEEFRVWRDAVAEYKLKEHKAALHSVLLEKALTPPLRPDITTLKFSPDGAWAFAQDEASVYVLSRKPFAFKFRIDAPDAWPAMFTPDNKSLVFYDHGLRVEKWDLAAQKRTWVREMTLPKSCLQSVLSPDGALLACLGGDFMLRLIGTDDSSTVFEKKEFFAPNVWQLFALLGLFGSIRDDAGEMPQFVDLQFSPDAHYLVAMSTTNKLVLDTSAHPPVPNSVKVPLTYYHRFAFLGPNRMAIEDGNNGERSKLVTFPEGEVVYKDVMLGSTRIEGATKGDYVLVRPTRNYAVSLVDLKANKIIVGNKMAAFDAYDDQFLSERKNGEIGLYDIGKAGGVGELVQLPVGPLGRLQAFEVSPNLKAIAVSLRRRGGVWNLETGDRLQLVTGFRGTHFEGDNVLYADFAEIDKSKRALGVMTLSTGAGGIVRQVAENPDTPDTAKEAETAEKEGRKPRKTWRVWQTGPVVFTLKPHNPKTGLSEDVELEAADLAPGKLLWSRSYKKERPSIEGTAPRENTMVISWPLTSKSAKEELDGDPALARRAAGFPDKESARLLEVLDMRTGKPAAKLLVGTGKGSFTIHDAHAAGAWLLIRDEHNRVVVYQLSTGEQKTAWFGSTLAASSAAHLLALENKPGQVSLYSLNNLEKQDELAFRHGVADMDFSTDGKRLLVLTKDQTAYVIDVSKLEVREPAAAAATAK